MTFTKKTIKDINVVGKTVLVRASLNVPIKVGKVENELRLKAGLPTLNYLLGKKAKLILISHHSDVHQSLQPIAPVLAKLLKRPVKFVNDSIGPKVSAAAKALQPGDVLMLENLRFHKGEEANDPAFAKKLASLADIYVDDDFTTTHREHASMVGIPKFLPAVAGFQIENEVAHITKAMSNPKKPLLLVVGGAKISTKIALIDNLMNKSQAIFIGGAMANDFLLVEGLEIGKSLADEAELSLARKVMNEARDNGIQLFLPLDVVVASNIDEPSHVKTVKVYQVSKSDIIGDVGPKSVAQIQPVLNQKGTVIWNGTLGIAEQTIFAKGSKDLAKRIINSGATSLVGGGDTAAFVDSLGWHDDFTFVSMGGGASLELMSGQKLPAVEALEDK